MRESSLEEAFDVATDIEGLEDATLVSQAIDSLLLFPAAHHGLDNNKGKVVIIHFGSVDVITCNLHDQSHCQFAFCRTEDASEIEFVTR